MVIHKKEKIRLGGETKDFRTLKVWEKAHGVVPEIYKVTIDFPKQEI
jgi:hypothetical protein